MFRNKILLSLALICLLIGLLMALIPFSDFDQDGNSDSFLTEGLVLLPVFSAVIGLCCLLTRLPVDSFAVLQQFSPLIVPPPISA